MMSSYRWTLLLILLSCLLPTNSLAQALRVDVNWLQARLGADSPAVGQPVIVDARDHEDFTLAHIPGAVNLPEKLTYQDKASGGLIATPNSMQALLRERGIDIDRQVVVYDDGTLIPAARVFWTLEVYGIRDVRILDGGFADWLSAGMPTTDEAVLPEPSDYVAHVDHRRIASKFTTRLATLNPQQFVVDARPNKAYRGETSTAKRFGHIPSAINIAVHEHFEKQANNANHLLSLDELAQLYSGIPRDQKVVLYCEVGTVSSTNYLVMRELGYDVANYDASWREWGNDFSLPIEK